MKIELLDNNNSRIFLGGWIKSVAPRETNRILMNVSVDE